MGCGGPGGLSVVSCEQEEAPGMSAHLHSCVPTGTFKASPQRSFLTFPSFLSPNRPQTTGTLICLTFAYISVIL